MMMMMVIVMECVDWDHLVVQVRNVVSGNCASLLVVFSFLFFSFLFACGWVVVKWDLSLMKVRRGQGKTRGQQECVMVCGVCVMVWYVGCVMVWYVGCVLWCGMWGVFDECSWWK
jgi:hypothetical protein